MVEAVVKQLISDVDDSKLFMEKLATFARVVCQSCNLIAYVQQPFRHPGNQGFSASSRAKDGCKEEEMHAVCSRYLTGAFKSSGEVESPIVRINYSVL